ncbi:MAG: hypothetical protein ACI36X_02665 [Bacteroidaceae bacterium]
MKRTFQAVKRTFQGVKRTFQGVKRTFQGVKRTFQGLEYKTRAGIPPFSSTSAGFRAGTRTLLQAGCNGLATTLQRACNTALRVSSTAPRTTADGKPDRFRRIASRKQMAAFPDIFPYAGAFAWQSVVLCQSGESPISLFLPIPKNIERELQPGGEAYGAFLSCPQKPTGFPLTPLL